MLGWSISLWFRRYFRYYSFSPLRCWGGLYLFDAPKTMSIRVLVPFDVGVVYITPGGPTRQIMGFSPLRCWGGLYRHEKDSIPYHCVLVPFDVGVVYIHDANLTASCSSFSPLRCWGGLYQIVTLIQIFFCFSPLRCWGGLYQYE